MKVFFCFGEVNSKKVFTVTLILNILMNFLLSFIVIHHVIRSKSYFFLIILIPLLITSIWDALARYQIIVYKTYKTHPHAYNCMIKLVLYGVVVLRSVLMILKRFEKKRIIDEKGFATRRGTQILNIRVLPKLVVLFGFFALILFILNARMLVYVENDEDITQSQIYDNDHARDHDHKQDMGYA